MRRTKYLVVIPIRDSVQEYETKELARDAFDRAVMELGRPDKYDVFMCRIMDRFIWDKE